MRRLRVAVVDDSPFIRRVLTDWIRVEPDMELAGIAADGSEAVELVRRERPDVVTLDVEMPVRDGLDALAEIMRDCPTPVLMVSSVTTQGAQAAIRSLELGAIDFVAKPQGHTSVKFVEMREELLAKIRATQFARLVQPAIRTVRTTVGPRTSERIVLVASSTGGPRALQILFESLPKGFAAPMLIVQHMPPTFTRSFAQRLNSIGTLPCKEAEPGDRIVPGLAILARGGLHMRVARSGAIELDEGPMLHGVRPSADVLFLSAVEAYGARCVGAVLTGMGRDGAEGAAALVRRGCPVFGESEATCTIYGMPKAAREAGGVSLEVPIDRMAEAIASSLSEGLEHAS